MKKILSFFLTLTVALSILTISVTSFAAGSATGTQIVQTAMQYIGKVPYVWGGTNIDGVNPGADCSGFICRIYEKFGIDMWANRTRLRNCGTNLGTDMSVAALGDIIWYEGHVAIYAGLDSAGDHTVVHETGGNIQNVAYSKHKHVRAELKGIIRIPGVINAGASVELKKVTFSENADAEYAAKRITSDTNAVLVNKITKLPGVNVTKMGVMVFDANGNCLKKHYENVSNVPSTQTTYHSWYDVNSELGITLEPGTSYMYRFFGVFDGQEIASDTNLFFKTTDCMVVNSTYTISFVTDMYGATINERKIKKGDMIGSLPVSNPPEGYECTGYYTSQVGGTRIFSNHTYDLNSDVTYYAQFKKIETTEEKDETPVVKDETPIVEENETHTVYFWSQGMLMGSKGVKNGDTYGDMPEAFSTNGYTFDGYYTKANGGVKITENTIVDLNGYQNLYARFIEPEEELVIKLTIGNSKIKINDKSKNIDNLGTVPYIKNGRTLLPVRAVFEAMGGNVGWDGTNQVVTLELDNTTLFLKIGSNTAWDNKGEFYSMDVGPVVNNGRTMLPIRFVVEYFNGDVDWDNSTETVTIIK